MLVSIGVRFASVNLTWWQTCFSAAYLGEVV
jgi:hypothetical protein